MSNEWDIERAIDAMTASGLSRRTLMRRAGAGAMSLGVIGFLAACGDDGGSADSAKTIPKGEIAKNMTFANWPYYIDVKGKSTRRSTSSRTSTAPRSSTSRRSTTTSSSSARCASSTPPGTQAAATSTS